MTLNISFAIPEVGPMSGALERRPVPEGSSPDEFNPFDSDRGPEVFSSDPGVPGRDVFPGRSPLLGVGDRTSSPGSASERDATPAKRDADTTSGSSEPDNAFLAIIFQRIHRLLDYTIHRHSPAVGKHRCVDV
nr:MAG: hypothetical protein J07AB56_10300 [Candidatus Nanosalinarum sp. J07AB56]